jgi:hypothetical protein
MEDTSRIIIPLMCMSSQHIEEGKARLQFMLREGKHPVSVEKRYPDGSLLRLTFNDGMLSVERLSCAGELLRRDVEMIVPAIKGGAEARIN